MADLAPRAPRRRRSPFRASDVKRAFAGAAAAGVTLRMDFDGQKLSFFAVDGPVVDGEAEDIERRMRAAFGE